MTPLVLAAVIAAAALLIQQSQSSAPPAAPPGTDIHEIRFDGTLDGLARAVPHPIAVERGYENQPHYADGGAALLFTANRDGKQTDIYEYDTSTAATRAVTSTAEGEYSPVITPDGRGISVIRVERGGRQRLWRVERSGGPPVVLLPGVQPVGYHVWIGTDELVLFVLGQPATLLHVRVSGERTRALATDIGRSLQRTPSGRVSFVQRDADGAFWIHEFEPSTASITRVVQTVAGSSDRDHAWLADGTLLMAAGTRIVAWRRGQEGWRDVLDVDTHQLGAVTRMAASPDGRRLAIVVAEPAAAKAPSTAAGGQRLPAT